MRGNNNREEVRGWGVESGALRFRNKFAECYERYLQKIRAFYFFVRLHKGAYTATSCFCLTRMDSSMVFPLYFLPVTGNTLKSGSP